MNPPDPVDLPWRLDPELRSLLVCPACRGPLLDRREGLACRDCALLYPVEDDVPCLIPEEARPFAEPA